MGYALVTGSSRGIGRAIAIQLAKDGYDIFVHCKEKVDKANEVAQEIIKLGRKAIVLKGDIAKDEVVNDMLAQISNETRSLDLLVNNAAFDYALMIEDFSIQQMREVVEGILISRMNITKQLLPLLKLGASPSIINIASRMGGPKTIPTVGAYAPAEAGVIKFTQCCALEFAKYKIRVNAIAPGFTDTEMTRNIYTEESFWIEMAEKNPSGRVGHPQDVANAVSFLASDKASYINATVLEVNGGSNLV